MNKDLRKYNINNFKFFISQINVINGNNQIIVDPVNNVIESTAYSRIKDRDMSDIAIDFYKKYFKWWEKNSLRGDTICSFGTVFGKCNLEGNLKELKDGRSWKRGYTGEIFRNKKPQVMKFRSCYHSLANFWIMPGALNMWRGLSCSHMGDFFDIFLNAIRNYYLEPDKNPLEVQKRLNAKDALDWLEYWERDENPWEKFVTDNYLEMFTNSRYEVKDLFADPEDYRQQDNNNNLIGGFHGYGYEMVWKAKNKAPGECAKAFLENSIWVIEERAKKIFEYNQKNL